MNRTITCLLFAATMQAVASGLEISWEKNYLTIFGDVGGKPIPGESIEIHYLEAYCRANSQTTDWTKHTVVGHKTELVSASVDRTKLHLRCILKDGVVVDHRIEAKDDEINFDLTAHNPTNVRSEAHWAQPCIRVGKFTGCGAEDTEDAYAYIKKSFVFLDGRIAFMPTRDWAMEARYIPGQVWAAPGVPRADVNPRPLHPSVPSNGLIGCVSGDDKMVFAVAFEPYQELFQGVIRCLHSDFRLGGLKPNEMKRIRGKIYIVPNDMDKLLARYQKDFPEHTSVKPPAN
ncbi:MAG: hypothetical protein KDB27_29965 [Planctomycetales bacterium]|nr:hypothetical protein [Planctomycetales bacterium]